MTIETFFTTAAVIGGAVLAFQFVMMLLGLGDHHHDISGLHHADAGSTFHDGDFSGGHDAGMHHDAGAGSHAANWFYEIISIRTVSAGLAVFGLMGRGMLAWHYSPAGSFIAASLAGFGAMYGVYWLYKQVFRLQNSGTENIRNAIGTPAVVYIPIAPKRASAGKVTFRLQNRLVEYLAMTDEDSRLATGEKVVVTAIVSPDTVLVERVPAPVEDLVSNTTPA
jgi:hypothetical protein